MANPLKIRFTMVEGNTYCTKPFVNTDRHSTELMAQMVGEALMFRANVKKVELIEVGGPTIKTIEVKQIDVLRLSRLK